MEFFLFIFFSLIKGAVRDAAQLPVLRIIDFLHLKKDCYFRKHVVDILESMPVRGFIFTTFDLTKLFS